MNPLEPNLPRGSRIIINALYPKSDSVLLLTDDLFLAKLPNGVFIDVGWSPECDPTGTYKICVYRGEFDNQLISPIETKEPGDVVDQVEYLAATYGIDRIIPVSTADDPKTDIRDPNLNKSSPQAF